MTNYSNGSSQKGVSQGRRLVILSGVTLALLAGMGSFALGDSLSVDSSAPSGGDARQGVQQSSGLSGTDLQSFIASHGPWLTTSEANLLKTEVGIRNLALIQSNGVIYSSKSVKFDGKSPWKSVSNPPQIIGVNVADTTLTVETNKGDIYTFNVTQPFMVEDNLGSIFIVDRNKKLWAAQVGLLKFEEANTLTDSGIGVNPNISTSIGN